MECIKSRLYTWFAVPGNYEVEKLSGWSGAGEKTSSDLCH